MQNTHVCIVSTRVPGLIFAQLSTNVEAEVGFKKVPLVTACLTDVAMVTDLWRVLAKIDTPRLHSVRWHSTTDGNIASPIVALTLTMIPLR